MIRALAAAATLFSIGVAPSSASSTDDRTAVLRALAASEDLACLRAIGARPDLEWRRIDLDGDGRDEVVVLVGGVGNGATSCLGDAGRYVHLMIRTRTGEWRDQLGFSASDVSPIPRGRGAWLDLEIQGPGPCRPVWRNRGSGYRGLGNCN